MKIISKQNYILAFMAVVLVLAIVRCARPEVARGPQVVAPADSTLMAVQDTCGAGTPGEAPDVKGRMGLHSTYAVPTFRNPDGSAKRHKVYSVPGFSKTFPDLQDVQIQAARRWGVSPVQDRAQAEHRKNVLVYVGSNPYYVMDKRMGFSIPYLVPRASDLLQRIGRNFLDSLAIKGIPLHTIIVSSVLRTEHDVARLRRSNPNASGESCHRYGTTFDICYNRYHTVSRPGEPERRAVRSDSLKWVLSEVLRDLRESNLCYVKYEVKQGCFHITVR